MCVEWGLSTGVMLDIETNSVTINEVVAKTIRMPSIALAEVTLEILLHVHLYNLYSCICCSVRIVITTMLVI